MSYLQSQTSTLTSTEAVSPAQAQAAQIPLQSFTLPTFPEEAFAAGLTSLILTADIKLDEYTSLLTSPFSVPDLPKSITSLTLELFSLGYPPGFLSELGKKLSALKSLTIYSGLLGGTTGESRKDALEFIASQTALKELHLLDVFGPKGFFQDLGSALSSELKFLEISFTYRHSDTAFLNTLPSGQELAGFVEPGLLGLTVRISEPEVVEEDEDDREGTEEGIMAAQRKDGAAVIEAVMKNGKDLKVLDLTMFEMALEDVERVVGACPDLKVLGISAALQEKWEEIFDVLGKRSTGVEILEVVGVPGTELVERMKSEGEPSLGRSVLEGFAGRWVDLKVVKLSILRTGVEQWAKEGGKWEKQALE